MLEALVGAHEIELIRIFLTKSRQDGDLQTHYINMISCTRCNRGRLIDVHEYIRTLFLIILQCVPQSDLGAHTMDGSLEF